MTDAQIADSGVGTGSGPAAEPGGGPHSRWHRLRQPEALLPLILIGVFLVLWALVLARPTFLTSFDVWARDHVQNRAHATDGRHRWPLVKDIADLAGGVTVHGLSFQIQVPMVALALAGLAGALICRSWKPILAMAAGYAALLVVLILKAIGNRPGPSMAGQALVSIAAPPRAGGLGYFPSGHTGNTMLCYGTSALIMAFVFTGRLMRIVIATTMTLWALTVGFSLVWMDYHWVSDVLGSYALCGAALFGVARILGFRISRS